MEADPLAEACKLAFEVARQGVEADPPVDPPAPMRSFLYVAQLPRRAMTVAHRVIDGDPDFRSRVASQATEAKVGKAGHLWLHRPVGWESDFSSLTGTGALPAPPPPPAPQGQRAAGATQSVPPPMPSAPSTVAATTAEPEAAASTPAPVTPAPVVPAPVVPAPVAPAASVPAAAAQPAPVTPASAPAADGPGPNDIESELANLRGLVDRLAEERQNVGSSVENLESEVVERRAESSALTTQLDSASTDLQRSRDERDAALTEKEGAIAKQIALEQELTELRVELQNNQVQASRFDIERADAASDLAAANERIAAAELQNAGFDEERASLRTQMDSIVAERDDAWQNMADNRTHTEDLANRLQVAEQARVDLETELADVSAKWQDLRVEMHSITEQRLAIETELQQLTETREASESNRAELFSELGSELGRVEAERDLLARKLELAQSRLADTRTVLEGATTSLTTELDGVDEAFGQTSQAAADLDRAVSGASQRLSDLEAEMSGAGIPDAGSLDTGSTSVVEHSQDASFSDDNASEQSDAANHQDLTIFGEPGPIAKAVVAPPVGEIAATLSPFASAAEPSEFIGDPAVDLPLEDPFKDIGEQDAAADDAGVVDEVDSFAAVDAPATDEADTRDLDDVLASYGLGAEEADVSDVYEVSDIADTTDQSTGPDPVSMMPDSPVESLPIEDAEVLGITDDSDELTALAYLPAPDPTDVALDDPAPVAAVAASGERRAQIAPISGDPLAVARHMVTTPEVVLLLVGDPIASLGWPSLGVAERRDALVSYLGDLAADTGAASDVVFDGTVGDETQLPVSRAVRVRLTHPGIEASAAAAEVIDQYPREWPVVVVSDDPSLTKSAIDKGASVLDNGQLLDLFYPS